MTLIESMRDDSAPSNPAAARRSRVRSVTVFVIGAVLLGLAIWYIAHSGTAWSTARDAAARAPLGLLLVACILPLINITVVSLSFSVLTGRYGRVGILEMQALVTSAWLLNVVPFRPGLLGRVAYHKAINGIPIRDSIKVLLQAIACNVVGMLFLLSLALNLHTHTYGEGSAATWHAMKALAALFCVLLMIAGMFWFTRKDQRVRQGWRIPAAIMLRMIDICVWISRYVVAFAILGVPLPLLGATVVALASEAAMLAPVQLGLREWVVGVVGSAFVNSASTIGPKGAADPIALGLMADIFCRAIEVLVAVPVGVPATLWILRRLAKPPAAPQSAPATEPLTPTGV
jgi:hypothetical protein